MMRSRGVVLKDGSDLTFAEAQANGDFFHAHTLTFQVQNSLSVRPAAPALMDVVVAHAYRGCRLLAETFERRCLGNAARTHFGGIGFGELDDVRLEGQAASHRANFLHG